MEYGTLEPLREEKRSAGRKTLVVAMCAFAVVAVAGLAASGKINVNSVVDSNRGRKVPVPVDSAVQKAFQQVCDRKLEGKPEEKKKVAGKDVTVPGIPDQLRFNVAGLKKNRSGPKYSLVPQVTYGATDDWINDWKMFKTMMPDQAPAVGFGVYNFPVWKNKQKTAYDMYSAFVTYQKTMKPYPDLSAKYLGGTFLGSALLAASGSLEADIPTPKWLKEPEDKDVKRPCIVTAITIDQSTSYQQACMQVVMNTPGNKSTKKQALEMCRAVKVDSCPFAKTKDSPCCQDKTKCKKSCELVTAWMGDEQYPKACCKAIKDWCKGGAKKTGCGRFQKAVYARNCNPSFGQPAPPALILPGLKEKLKCEKQCQEPCKTFRFAKNTFRKCAGCAVDHVSHKYKKGTFIAKCHSEAEGFFHYRCCGGAACAAGKGPKTCEIKTTPQMVANKEKCQWLTHTQCSDKMAAIAAKKAAAAKKKAAAAAKKKAAAAKAAAAKAKKAAAATKKKAAAAAKKKKKL